MSYKLQYINTLLVKSKLYFVPDDYTGPKFAFKPVSIYPVGHKLSKNKTKVFSKYPSMHRSLNYEPSRKNEYWKGGLADMYGIKNLKGTGAEMTPYVRIAVNSNYDVRILGVEGLVTKKEIDKLIKFENIRRKIGLLTDRTSMVYEIFEVMLGDKLVSIDFWKNWAVDEMEEEIDRRLSLDFRPDKRNKMIKSKILSKIKKYVKNTRFFVIERDLQVSERVRDLARCKSEKELHDILCRVFEWLNRSNTYNKIGKSKNKMQIFNIQKKPGVDKYFKIWLPSQMGFYLGSLHKAGYFSDNAHAQNWSAVGTLYDISGGIKKISDNVSLACVQRNRDLFLCGHAFIELYNPLSGNYLKNKDCLYDALVSFLNSYNNTFGGKITTNDLDIFLKGSIDVYKHNLGINYVDSKMIIDKEYHLRKLVEELL